MSETETCCGPMTIKLNLDTARLHAEYNHLTAAAD